MQASVHFSSTLPPKDHDLAKMVGACSSIEMSREGTMLMEVVRVLDHNPKIKELEVSGLSMLAKSETDTFVYGTARSFVDDKQPAEQFLWTLNHPVPNLEKIYITGKFQPRCNLQMKWIASLLREALCLQQLNLNMFEYPTDAFVPALKSRMPSLIQPLPGLLGMEPKPAEGEMEGKEIGAMMASRILGCTQSICNVSDMDDMLTAILSSRLQTVARECVATTSNTTVGAVLDGDAHFRCMSYEQYEDMMQILYTTPLPEGLEHLSLRVVLRGGGVNDRFLYLPCLKTLDLQYCEIDDGAFKIIGPTIGRRMPSLEKLMLGRNRLESAELGLVIGHTLQELDYSFNPITSWGAGHLFGCMEYNNELHLVDLSYTRITRDVCLRGLDKWTAAPGRLMIPECFSMEDLHGISMFVHENVEIEMISMGGRGLLGM